MSQGAIFMLGDAMGLSTSPMCFSPKFGDGGENDPQCRDALLLGDKKQTPRWICIGQGDARPQSAREDIWDKNAHSDRGIVSNDDLKIRVGDRFIKN